MSLKNQLYELMAQYRFSPSRKMAQVIMVNEALLTSMVKAGNITPKDTVLEIGSGTGFLTRKLLDTGAQVIGVELDAKMVALLQNEITSPRFTLLPGSVLEVPLPKFNKIVSNPPYTISRELMYLLFSRSFETAVLTFQKEFAEKLVASPGFGEYSALSVLTQYHYDTRILHPSIPRASFYPAPNTLSAMIQLTPHTRHGQARQDTAFAAFVRCLFRFRNKNLHNALQKSLPFIEKECRLNPKRLEKVMAESPLMDEKTMGIEVREWVALFNEISDGR